MCHGELAPFLRGASCFLPCAELEKQTRTAKAESGQFLSFLLRPRWVCPIYPSAFRIICNNFESVQTREVVQISQEKFPTIQKDLVQSPYFPIRFLPYSSPWNCSLASLRSCNTRACNRSRRPTRNGSLWGSAFARKVFCENQMQVWTVWTPFHFAWHPNCVFHSPCFGHFKRRWWRTSRRRLPSQLRLRKNKKYLSLVQLTLNLFFESTVKQAKTPPMIPRSKCLRTSSDFFTSKPIPRLSRGRLKQHFSDSAAT